jgi:CheY-like chemotaxis protein
MNQFRVLVVDNDQAILDNIRDSLGPLASKVNLHVASDIATGQRLVKEQFFHAAFIDLDLKNDDRAPDYGGKTILSDLRDMRKSCRRFLLTATADKKTLFEILRVGDRPEPPLITGILDKMNYRVQDIEVIGQMTGEWLKYAVEVDGAAEIHAMLVERKVPQDTNALLTVEEVDYLVSKIFGQGEEHGASMAVTKIRLEPQTGGRSRSVVARGKPVGPEIPRGTPGREGILTIIKFSDLEEAREEYYRYCRHVRFMLSLNRRVEMLGYFEADTIGAMCYSFAGGSPNSSASLEHLFKAEDPIATKYLNKLFESSAKEWYAQKGDKISQTKFFSDTYHFDSEKILKRVTEFARTISPKIGGTYVPEERSIQFDGFKILLPNDALLGLGILNRVDSCIVHGDLNAGNIIVSLDDERVFFIDYRHTGLGPVALDFAALESSVRVFSKPVDLRPETVREQRTWETRIWEKNWKEQSVPETGRPYWAEIADRLMNLARANFPEMSPGEYAGTCLLWALRVFRVGTLNDWQRLRLLLWMSNLIPVLKAGAAGKG